MNDYCLILRTLCCGFANFPDRVEVERVNPLEYGVRCAPADQGKLIGKSGANAAVLRGLLNHRLAMDGERPVSVTIMTGSEQVPSVPEWTKQDWNGNDAEALEDYFFDVLHYVTGKPHDIQMAETDDSSKIVLPGSALPTALQFSIRTLAKAVGRVRGRKVVLCFDER